MSLRPKFTAQKLWLPEIMVMLENLPPNCSHLTMDDLCLMTQDLCMVLMHIRKQLGIKPYKSRTECMACGKSFRYAVFSMITVSGVLYQLYDLGKLNEIEYNVLKKQWIKFRKSGKLNAQGNASSIIITCPHCSCKMSYREFCVSRR